MMKISILLQKFKKIRWPTIPVQKLKTIRWPLSPILVLSFLLVLRWIDPFDLSQLGSASVLASADTKPVSNVVILDIDAASQGQYGHWPFDRKDLTQILGRLKAEGAGVIIVDLPLNHPDRARGDDEFAKAIGSKNVILVQNATNEEESTVHVPKKLKGVDDKDLSSLNRYTGAISPLGKFLQNAAGVGTTDFPGTDKIYNRHPLLLAIGESYYPSPILEAVRHTLHESGYEVSKNGRALKISIGQFLHIPVDSAGKFFVNYNHEIETIKLSSNKLKNVQNKIVVVGSSIKNVNHLVNTPAGKKYSHEVQAHALQTILEGLPPLRSPFVLLFELVVGCVSGVALWYFWQRKDLVINVMKLLLLVGITTGVPFIALVNINVLFDPVWPTILATGPLGYTALQKYRHLFKCYLCQWICGNRTKG